MLDEKSALRSARPRGLRAALLAMSLAGLLAAGCGDEATPPVTGDSNNVRDDDKWCDALEVLRDACQECHSRKVESTAPMPLDTYKDLMADGITDDSKKIYELVAERIHDKKRPMPEPPRALSKSQLAALDAWIEAGAPSSSDPTCEERAGSGDGDDSRSGDGDTGGDGDTESGDGDGDTGGDGDSEVDAGSDEPVTTTWPSDCEEFHKVLANDSGKPHKVAANSQTHPQFYFDAPWGDAPVQALAFKPITNNKKVLHHWILYENGQDSSALGGKFLTGWAPGKDGIKTFPDDVGVYLPSGKGVLRLDTHYYNMGAGAKAETDASGVEICVVHQENFREHTAGTFAFGTLIFNARANQKTAVKAPCNVSTSGGSAYLLSSSPHMHRLGYWAKFWRTRSGTDLMLQDTSFNFEFQEGKSLDRVELKSGDRVTVQCDFDNDTSNDVKFGQDTEDEMCFNFALYYPMGGLNCSPVFF